MAETSGSRSLRKINSNTKFEIEKYNGANNFGMWQNEVMDILFQQELDITLEEKPDEIFEKEWIKMNRQACSSIRLCLAKDQKYFVMHETVAKDLWRKLEDNYMTKSVENRLYLKKKLFKFTYKDDTSMHNHLDAYDKILVNLRTLDVEIVDEEKQFVC